MTPAEIERMKLAELMMKAKKAKDVIDSRPIHNPNPPRKPPATIGVRG